MNSDGSVIISTELNNDAVEKDLQQLDKKIKKSLGSEKTIKFNVDVSETEKQLKKAERRIESLSEQKEFNERRLASVNLEKDTLRTQIQNATLQGQDDLAQRLTRDWDRLDSQARSYSKAIEDANTKIGMQKEKAGALAQQLSESSRHSGALDAATKKAQKSMQKLSLRMREVLRSALIFTLISQSLAAFRNWMGKVITANDEASAAVARLKGALLTMVQPLLSVVIPAFITLVNLLTQLVSIVAQVLASLFGTTLDGAAESAEALNAETEALEGVGGAAKKAGKSLASFDEINKLSSGSSGGGGASSGIAPDFSWSNGITDKLKEIAEAVMLIGAGLALWKISSALPDMLGTILGKLGGLLAALGGIKLFYEGVTDAWENGVDWGNLATMLAGVAAAALGLYKTFGPLGAGIALVVGGLAMLAVGLKDAFENGWTLQNLLTTLAGVIAAGLGISLLTGSWIPLLIAGIASALLAITVAMGQGDELLAGLKMALQGFLDFFRGIFTGNITLALSGVQQMFEGLKIAVSAVFESLRQLLLSLLDWIDEQTNGRLSGIIEAAKGFINAFFDFFKHTALTVIEGVKQVFAGLVEFIAGVFTADWDKAWRGIATMFKGIWNMIVGVVEGAINLLIDGINFLIRSFNQAFAIMRALTGYPPILDTFDHVELPRLAQGAVIPPNREFLAVLGDQKSGTNIEAPLSTIEEAVENVLNRRGGAAGGEQTIILECDKVQFAKLVYKLNQSESKRHGVSLVGV